MHKALLRPWVRTRKALVAALLLPFLLTSASISIAPQAKAVNTQADQCASTITPSGNADVINSVPGYCVVRFKTVGTTTWHAPAGVSYLQYLIVGGGGAGGRSDPVGGYEAGGGGAGGISTGFLNLKPNTDYNIVVGAGGTSTNTSPTAAGDSSAFGITGKAGGYGGYNNSPGGAGGSGGGGTNNNTAGGAALQTGYGNAGETPGTSGAGGGGGGAGGPGIGGNGGIGIASSITGTDTYYGDGGGAGYGYSSVTGSKYYSRRGGSGGGGTGASAYQANPTDATGYGGGGGGADGDTINYLGGKGYQGVVIVRWAMVPVVNGLTGYFRNDSSAYASVALNAITTDPNYCYSGIYTTLNIQWGTGNPNSSDGSIYSNQPSTSCNADYFTGYLYGYIKAPYTGTVTINEATDDGIVLVIDSQTVINRMGVANTSSGTINMVAGQILPIQIWFHEATGGAGTNISWSYTGQSQITIPNTYLGTTPGALISAPTVNGNCQIGFSASCPAYSPQEINKLYGTNTNGTYWLNVNGVAQQVYIIMDSNMDGGGYVMTMKGATGATTFGFSSSHWITNSTLNDNSTYLRRNDSNNDDAKFNAFNYLPASKVLAIFPSMTGTPTGAISGQSYGFTWNEPVPSDAPNLLSIWNNTSLQRTEILEDRYTIATGIYRQKLRTATSTDYGFISGTSSRFSTQANINWYGFNYRQREWNYPTNGTQARWGFGWNENGVANEDSNDMVGGIGITYSTTVESAGDINGCCSTYNGINSATKFEMYAKMADPSMLAPTGLTAVAHTGGTVTLSWNKASSTAPTEYVIQSHTLGTAWTDSSLTTQRVLMPGDTTSVAVNLSGLATTTTKYEYRVFARTMNGPTWVNSSSASALASTYLTPVVPSITLQPVDTSTTSGLIATFRTAGTTTDAGTISYQWQKSTTSGGSTFVNTSYGVDTGTTLVTSSLTVSDSGYKFRVIVINTIQGETNTVTSNVVTLTVNPPLTFTGFTSIGATIGKARVDTTTIAGGTGTKTVTVTLAPANSGITTDISTVNSDGKVKVTTAANALMGSYLETLTVSDTAGATLSLVIPITVNSVPTFGGGGIVTSGMVLNLDAGNSQSFAPSGATTWNDLSKITGNATLGTSTPYACNAPTYSSNYLGTLSFSSASNNCVEMPLSTSYNNFSVESWVNLNSVNGGNYTTVYSSEYDNVTGHKINFALYFDGSNHLMPGIYNSTTWINPFGATTPFSPSTNTWYDIVQTYDVATTSYKMYVNGSLYSTNVISTTPATTQNYFFIGRRWDTTGNYFNFDGQLPVLRIYNRALSAGEVLNNYSSLVWRFTGALATARTVATTTGFAYSPYSYAAYDGTPVKSFSLTGNATGATIDTSTANYATLNVPGTLAAGTYYETLTVVDTNSSTTILPITLTVNQAISLATSASTLQTTLGYATVDTVVATLGTGTKTFTSQSSVAIAGITLDTSTANQAVLKFSSSVPAGTYTETITATDAASATATSVITVIVNPVAVISGTASIQSTSGTAFTSAAYVATLGTGTKNFTVSVSPTNSGITLDTSTANQALIKAATGVTAQTYTLTLTTTDSVTAQTNYTVTLIVNPAISFTGTQAQIRKYGSVKQDTFTAVNGTGNKTFTFTPASLNFVTWDTTTANTARITIAAGLIPGTYYETITAADSVSATAQYLVTITSALADTLTVSVDTLTVLTYNTQPVNITPTITVTGLVNGDTGTAATYNYAGINGTSYTSSTTKPTNAGSYSVIPSALTLNTGSASYYTAITYVPQTLTVNRAHQAAVSVISTSGIFGTALPIYIGGGSGTGAVTDTVTVGSSASGCSITANVLTSTSLGYCNVQAVKSGDTNYFDETSTVAAVYFYQYISYFPQPVQSSGPAIGLTGGDPTITVAPILTLSVTSFTPSTGGTGTSVVITGTGFVGVTDVKFGRTPASSFVVNSPTQITAVVPGTINGAKIAIYTGAGTFVFSSATYGP